MASRKGYIGLYRLSKTINQTQLAIKTLCEINSIDIISIDNHLFVEQKYTDLLRSPDGCRFCCECREHKLLEYFYKSNPRQCTPCHIRLCEEWKKRNPERAAEIRKRTKKKHQDKWNNHYRSKRQNDSEFRDKHRLQTKLSKYKIDENFYGELCDKYCDGCVICGIDLPANKLQIDHCHITGQIRGLICRDCNWAIGHFKDSISALENAIEYLKDGCDHCKIGDQ